MRGMSGAERAVFGSTTEGVLRKADVSVLVVPDGWRPPRPDRSDLTGTGPIVAGLDQTMPAFAATAAASRLAALLGTSVDAVHVVPPLPVLSRWSAHAEAAVRERTQAVRAELTSALRHLPADAPVTLHVESGRVAERLAVAVAPAAGRHPLLVLGRRTRNERGGAPGATAYRVLSMSQVPVLMFLSDQ
jgi:nucleotide-binding universal stress UspA family protein